MQLNFKLALKTKNMLVNRRAIMRYKQPMDLPLTSWNETDRKRRLVLTPPPDLTAICHPAFREFKDVKIEKIA